MLKLAYIALALSASLYAASPYAYAGSGNNDGWYNGDRAQQSQSDSNEADKRYQRKER